MDDIRSGLKKNSVLIVDDEESNIIALTHILSPHYAVYVVKDGQDAIELSEEYPPDVILLDIIMPGMDGYEVLAALKASEKTGNIPVIFITGLSDPDDEEKGLSLGAADYISKPFSSAIVRLRVHNQMQIIEQTRQIIAKEIAERSSRERSEFISRMSHEMRTPMNAIMGLTAILRNSTEKNQRDDMLDKISAASNQLLRLIDDVLDISDIEDNNLRLSSSGFSFSGMLRSLLEIAGHDAGAKRQTLTTVIDPSIPDTVVGDEGRLGQVISSLLSNAVKFTPENGSIRLNAFALGVEDEVLSIQVDVIDSGIGISKEQQEALFTPFEQADGGVDRKFGGAGLSLAISQYIVELMDGWIKVESEPGKGSKFTVIVRLQLQAPDTTDDDRASLDGKIALFAEDVEINREIVIAMLEDTGLRFECAENGREALDMFRAAPGRYDVILMDINMPEMDGVEATRQIRALAAGEGARVPIIAMTANVLKSEVETYLAAGMDAHVGKPVDYAKLISTIEKWVGREPEP